MGRAPWTGSTWSELPMTWDEPMSDDELLAELRQAVAADGPEQAVVEMLLDGDAPSVATDWIDPRAT